MTLNIFGKNVPGNFFEDVSGDEDEEELKALFWAEPGKDFLKIRNK